MKIFVSHSSKDKWAVRRIAKDIEELGHTVFLDEKDILTGDSIDSSIKSHLKTSDHFLVLLSPASLQSQWVLIELGGAIALEKRIVPVLLYVGANELPTAINLKLARDINDIDKYYAELGGLPTPPKAAAIASKLEPRAKRKQSILSIGTKVRVARNLPPVIYRAEGAGVTWVEDMDQYLGQSGTITAVDSDGDYELDVDSERFAWAKEWLRIVPEKES